MHLLALISISVIPPVPSNKITGIGGSCLTASLTLVTVAGFPSTTNKTPGTFPKPIKILDS